MCNTFSNGWAMAGYALWMIEIQRNLYFTYSWIRTTSTIWWQYSVCSGYNVDMIGNHLSHSILKSDGSKLVFRWFVASCNLYIAEENMTQSDNVKGKECGGQPPHSIFFIWEYTHREWILMRGNGRLHQTALRSPIHPYQTRWQNRVNIATS